MDGTNTQADATLGDGKTGTPQTITREEHEKALRDARTAVMADVGRERKGVEDAMKSVHAAQDRLDKMVKDQEQAELESVRDDPEKLTAVQERQRRRAIETELATARLELNDKTTKLTAYESREAETARETRAREIATRLNVDPVRLAKLSKFTDGTPEAIEEIGKELPKGKREGLRADSNSSIGGGSSRDQIIAAYSRDPRDPAAKEAYLELRRKEGR